jgi:hypothetical protein
MLSSAGGINQDAERNRESKGHLLSVKRKGDKLVHRKKSGEWGHSRPVEGRERNKSGH